MTLHIQKSEESYKPFTKPNPPEVYRYSTMNLMYPTFSVHEHFPPDEDGDDECDDGGDGGYGDDDATL